VFATVVAVDEIGISERGTAPVAGRPARERFAQSSWSLLSLAARLQ
jgi:hypothetical protein